MTIFLRKGSKAVGPNDEKNGDLWGRGSFRGVERSVDWIKFVKLSGFVMRGHSSESPPKVGSEVKLMPATTIHQVDHTHLE